MAAGEETLYEYEYARASWAYLKLNLPPRDRPEEEGCLLLRNLSPVHTHPSQLIASGRESSGDGISTQPARVLQQR